MLTKPIIRLVLATETLEFTEEEIISAELVEESNPVSAEIPISVLEFRILSTDVEFSMFSDTYFDNLSERLPVMVYEQISGTEYFLGKYYLQDWKNISAHEFEFRAIDLVGVLDATDYDGGFWSSATLLSTVLSQVFDPITALFVLDPALSAVTLSGWIPPGTYRSALQQICFAAGAVITTARDGRLIISAASIPNKLYDVKITDSEKFMEQAVELRPLVTSIELIAHNYSQGTVQEEIFNKLLPAGNHKIVFEKPYYNIVIDGPGYTSSVLVDEANNFIVTEDSDYIEIGGEYIVGPNSLYLNMDEPGTVVITGYPWVDSKRSYLFYETVSTEYGNKNALKIQDATLVSDSNAQAILDKLRDYYRQRYTKTIKLLPTQIKPTDIAITNTYYDRRILGVISKMSTDLTGGCLAATELIGIEPVYILPADEPVRRSRTGIAVCGAALILNNGWREY